MNVSNSTYKAPPANDWTTGIHQVCVTNVTHKAAQQTGQNYLNIEFTGMNGDMKNRKIWKSFYLFDDTRAQKIEQWQKSFDLMTNMLIAIQLNEEIDLASSVEINKLKQRVLDLKVNKFKDKNTGESKAYVEDFPQQVKGAAKQPVVPVATNTIQANPQAVEQPAQTQGVGQQNLPIGNVDASLNDVPF